MLKPVSELVTIPTQTDHERRALEDDAEIWFNQVVAAGILEAHNKGRKSVSFPMPSLAFHKGGYDYFMQFAKRIFEPKGYRVYQSHDGGGMYATFVVRWNE